MRKIIAVIGNSKAPEGSKNYDIAFLLGKLIVDNGYRLQCGGLNGVMGAACKGAHSSNKYTEGDVIGILPGFNTSEANEYIDIPIATGLDLYRNVIVANANAVIAVGGAAGTLSEIANAWALKKLIVAMSSSEGWAAKVAGKPLDDRVRYPDIPDDKIYTAENPEEALYIINQNLKKYEGSYTRITPHN
ncbi:MAG: hypothetical protein BWX72_01999 [Firmicutes bacterium ADurb.Bin080]|jgi:uncharacterized protein (TIGR00725 family)|nr:TIGR00725 family protein [Clostridiales bacterium]OQC12349.1 MAG: hypothetical protein BWX72_01999 [Firmicutes bacterium ADurb.Bin080]